MTDEQAIQQLESALTDLTDGDQTAIERLPDISVGDITGSTAVAIGSNIRIAVKQAGLPISVINRLVDLADALDRQAQDSFRGAGHIRVFLSSPGDVSDERRLAMKAIRRLQNDPIYKERVTLEVVAWDKPDDSTPMLASMTPQEAINQGLARPSECDIVVVILWSRMGTPLPVDTYQKTDGSQYLSGTEWEFEDARAAAQETGKPLVIVYRRTEEMLLNPREADFEARLDQLRRVDAFFEAFANPDGSIRQGCNFYQTPSEFEDLFELHLRKLVARLIEEGQSTRKPAQPIITAEEDRIDWPADRSPFPGLRAFGPEDAPIFFGRGGETDALVSRLSDPGCRFLAVVGASGSGKSSLVGAGLIPRLADGAIPGSADWPVLRLTPDGQSTSNPFDALAASLIDDPLQVEDRDLADLLRHDPAAFRYVCQDALIHYPDWAQVVVFVDQFEELFTRVHDVDRRESFVSTLVEAAQSDRVKIVATLRADFFHRCAELPALSKLLKVARNGTFPLSAPEALDLHTMITEPAKVAGLRFEPGLARQILADTGDEPGALALMAYALEQLWLARTIDGELTQEAYDGFGGVQGAIGAQAQAAFEQLDAEAQAALPEVFHELIEVDERGTATRKRASFDSAARDEISARLIAALTDARLLVQSHGAGDSPVVEVAHEALFRSWPRLADWIAAAQDDLILLRQVRQAVQVWVDHDQDEAYLWPEERLQPVYAMLNRLQPALTPLERNFTSPEFERLLDELEQPEADAFRRAVIGDRLNAIGDPRPGVGVYPDGLPDIAWLPVEGGEIILEDVDGTFVFEPFYISQYPVTYRQFSAFVEAKDGYYNPAWWKGLAKHPANPGNPKFMFDNHPGTRVNWFDAVAFCRWLTANVRDGDGGARQTKGLDISPLPNGINLGKDWDIRLPTEWEWQFAATGGDLSRAYPWGPDFGDGPANTTAANLGRTTAVGMFPAGASPFGVMDMCGNIWEWCLNEIDTPQNTGLAGEARRVLRGGSWNTSPRVKCRMTYRARNDPSYRSDYMGFRVVLARKE